MATAICFALDPARDIYRVSERRRPGYVYLAEFLLLLLFLHVRLNIPELFGGILTKYWPLVVMVIAFVGVGLSELFERRGYACWLSRCSGRACSCRSCLCWHFGFVRRRLSTTS